MTTLRSSSSSSLLLFFYYLFLKYFFFLKTKKEKKIKLFIHKTKKKFKNSSIFVVDFFRLKTVNNYYYTIKIRIFYILKL